MMKLNNEIKTGIVVAVAAFFLFLIIYKIGGIGVEEGYELKCVFNYISGLEESAPVKLAGVKVGEVKNIDFSYDGDETKVLVRLSISKKARIREDSKIRISTTGLVGEKYIEITRGSKGSPFVREGSILVGEDMFEMEELVEMGRNLAARLDASMQDLQKLMGHADGLLVDNKDDIKVIIANLNDASENFKEFSDDIKRNPWKLLFKGKEVPPKEETREKKK